MEELEAGIQKKVRSFCSILPTHVDLWRSVLQDTQNPARALANFCEQLQCIEKSNIGYFENFLVIQQSLQTKISSSIQDELSSLLIHIEKLNKANHDLKNRLSILEKATIDLDWESDSMLVRGSPSQPPLCRILQMGYNFWMFFCNASKNINQSLKTFNIKDQKSIDCFQKSIQINLGNKSSENYSNITLLLALTQYVVNDRDVV